MLTLPRLVSCSAIAVALVGGLLAVGLVGGVNVVAGCVVSY